MSATVPITPPDVITQEFRTPRAVRRGVIAGVVGNMLEWCAAACCPWPTTCRWPCWAGRRRMALACGVTFVAALLLPGAVPHSMTWEFEAARFR